MFLASMYANWLAQFGIVPGIEHLGCTLLVALFVLVEGFAYLFILWALFRRNGGYIYQIARWLVGIATRVIDVFCGRRYMRRNMREAWKTRKRQQRSRG